jgi:hypothetical protein
MTRPRGFRREGGFHRVERDGRRIRALVLADEADADALRPQSELLGRRGSEGVARCEDDGAVLLQTVRDLRDRRGLAGAVDPRDEHHRRTRGGAAKGRAFPERMPFTWAFQEGDTLVRRLDRPILPCGSDGLHDLADGPRPDVGRIEVLFELIDEFRVEVATEGQDGADAAEDLLLRLAEALLEGRGEFAEHAVSLLPSRASNARFHPSRGRECR